MRRLVLRIAVIAVAVAILPYVLPQIAFGGDPLDLVVLALVFGVVNGLVKPVVKLLSFPLTLMTLGLFGVVVNAVLFLGVAWLSGELGIPFTVGGFPATGPTVDTITGAFAGSVVLGLVTAVLGLAVRD